MRLINYLILLGFLLVSLSGCEPRYKKATNIILIMADDMGYECLGSYGCTSYSTPALDRLAENGIRVTHCISQPLCTPSRDKIMTGLYNYRNYEYFEYLNPNQRTFAHLMKEAGYATCIAGKWQLNGLFYKLDGYQDNTRPYHFGFDEYCLWQLTHTRSEGERYAHPLIEQNGEILPVDSSSYGPDIFCDYMLDFIERNRESSFFVYYPMVLVHDPFVPTPDSEIWNQPEHRFDRDNRYFKDMVEYTDKIIGRLVDKLITLDLDKNTLIMFTGDNGTSRAITTDTDHGQIRGGKGKTTDAGTHVPLIIYWPAKIKKGKVFNGLIEFSDFYPTLGDIVGIQTATDGVSFYRLLIGKKFTGRETAFVHYDPEWGDFANQFRNQFARTIRYKLYQDGRFYDLEEDILEQHPVSEEEITEEILGIRDALQQVFDQVPDWVEDK